MESLFFSVWLMLDVRSTTIVRTRELRHAALSPGQKPTIEGLVGKHRKLRGGGEEEGPIKFTLPPPPSSPSTHARPPSPRPHHTEKLTGGGGRG